MIPRKPSQGFPEARPGWKPRTRFAPTPSGLLHAGNAWSLLLTWLAARSRGGSIRLRIDDLDAARFREEYLEDIFASLEWLGLDWDAGPRSPAEFRSGFSQRLRLGAYRAAAEKLAAARTAEGPLVYACACGREKVKRDSREAGRPGIYPGTCRDAGLSLKAVFGGPLTARDARPLRLRVPGNATVTVAGMADSGTTLFPGRDMGDFVVWQRNGEPAYQLASLVDDEEFGTDLIVRGEDLLPSTGAQAWLAGLLGYGSFPAARFLHHGLMLDSRGAKLSKTEGAVSLRFMRGRLGGPGPLLAFFARALGIPAGDSVRAADLLPGFAQERIPVGPLYWEDLVRETGMRGY